MSPRVRLDARSIVTYHRCSLEFVDMLNAMRFGEMNEEITRAFRLLSRPVTYDDGILPTEL